MSQQIKSYLVNPRSVCSLPIEITIIILYHTIYNTPFRKRTALIKTLLQTCKPFRSLILQPFILFKMLCAIWGGDDRYALLSFIEQNYGPFPTPLLQLLVKNAPEWVHDTVTQRLLSLSRKNPLCVSTFMSLVLLGKETYPDYYLPPEDSVSVHADINGLLTEDAPYQVALFFRLAGFWAIYGPVLPWYEVEWWVTRHLRKDNHTDVSEEDDGVGDLAERGAGEDGGEGGENPPFSTLRMIWEGIQTNEKTSKRLRDFLIAAYLQSLNGDGDQLIALKIRTAVGHLVEDHKPPHALIVPKISGADASSVEELRKILKL
ncbi:hypothetical protein HK097_002554, partial [Rhizophlyctis rosea]